MFYGQDYLYQRRWQILRWVSMVMIALSVLLGKYQALGNSLGPDVVDSTVKDISNPIILAKLTAEEKARRKQEREQKRQERLQKRQQIRQERERRKQERERLEQARETGAVFKPNKLIVTVEDTPDPAPVDGDVKYQVKVINDGAYRSFEVLVTVSVPEGTEVQQCWTSIDRGNILCRQVGNMVLATLGTLKAHRTVTVSLILQMPSAPTQLKLTAQATGEQAFKGQTSESTTVLGPYGEAVLLPSGLPKSVGCGDTLNQSFFGADTTVQLTTPLTCTGTPFGLQISASGVTLDLNRNRIIGSPTAGTVGILIDAGATDVTIIGGSTGGSSGIQYFDWCIKDEGGNTGLVIKQVRCFRARSAGIDIASNEVHLDHVLIDNTIPTPTSTAELPGGVGIRARGDNILIKDSIVRRSYVYGIWADGIDSDGNNQVVTIDGNVRSMRVERNYNVGIFLEQGPHIVKGVKISSDGPDEGDSTDGLVLAANGRKNTIYEISVRNHNGNGIVIDANDTLIERASIENVGLDGIVVRGSNTILNGNKVSVEGDGFVVEGPDNSLTNNIAEDVGGSGFVVAATGDRTILDGNKAKRNGTHGYVLAANGMIADTNVAENNTHNGFLISGNQNTIENNSSKNNAEIGFEVTGDANVLNTNDAADNEGYEWIIASGNFDDGSNEANGNRISFSFAAGGAFE